MVVISCQILRDMFARLLPSDVVSAVEYMDYGLHRSPALLTEAMQEAIDRVEEASLVVLGFGLCGNGLSGLRAGPHTLLAPRAHDCIALLLGSRQAYANQCDETPGTYYLSKGWLEAATHPLQEYERYKQKYGEEQAMWLMDEMYQHYERLVLVGHTSRDLEESRSEAQNVARFLERWDVRYEELLGSDEYVRRLVEVALDLSQADGDFVVVPPGGVIRAEQFME